MAARDRLFEVPSAEFTNARNALVKELRAAGKTEEAKSVASLRKPTAALWVANQLAREAPDDVEALIHSAERMRHAHSHGQGDELRDAMREQREAFQAIARTAEQAAKRIGAHANLDLVRRVQETAQAAAATAPGALRSGTLEHELAPAGFEALAGTKVAPPRPRAKATRKAAADDGKRAREQQADLRRELREAERTAHALEKQATAAVETAQRAQRAADEAQANAVEAQRRAREAAEAALSLRKKL